MSEWRAIADNLRLYAAHKKSCAFSQSLLTIKTTTDPTVPCDCGFDALLNDYERSEDLPEEDDAFISLRCHCTAPIAIRLSTVPHGLLAGWKCQHCGQTLMLSDFARIAEGWESGRDFHSPKYKLFHAEEFPAEAVTDARRQLGMTNSADSKSLLEGER